MNCEVCFTETTGRRCAKHPETKSDIIYREIRENPLVGLQCQMQELEARQEPCYYQDTSKNEQVLPTVERPATPTQFQQIKGDLNHLRNKLNDHIDLSKKRKSKY